LPSKVWTCNQNQLEEVALVEIYPSIVFGNGRFCKAYDEMKLPTILKSGEGNEENIEMVSGG